MTLDTGLDGELDALYRAPLAEFVERRDALAKRLKLAGADDDARRVKAMRKPSVVAWAINRLQLESGGLAPLEVASVGLRRAMRDPGSAEERRSAIEARRRALESVTAAVVGLIEGAGTQVAPALLRRIERTLLALAAGAGGADGPVAGRLDQELEPPGFEALLESPMAGAAAPPAKGAAPAKSAAKLEGSAAAKGAAAAKSARTIEPAAQGASPPRSAAASGDQPYASTRDRQREAALATARRAVDDSEAELERATVKAEAARARVDDAEKALEKAKREVEAARRELVAARTRLSERRRDLDRARSGR